MKNYIVTLANSDGETIKARFTASNERAALHAALDYRKDYQPIRAKLV